LNVVADSRISELHLAALRFAARFGHIRLATIALSHLFPSGNEVLVIDEQGGRLKIPLSDAYWARLVVGWEHEPEVDAMFGRAFDHQADAYLFDCGANIGYWAARYASRVDLVLAVEPVPDTYARLQVAATTNGFLALHAAIWSRSDERIRITWDAGSHASASAVRGKGRHLAEVPTVTLAELVASYGAGHPVVVKLDIEGAEAEAVAGAEPVLSDILIIYEDHGSDTSHRATRAMLQRGLTVTFFDGNSPRRVDTLDRCNEIKSTPTVGYNFVAHHHEGQWRDWLDA
jgi:FkbM family methyltransferase